MELIFVFIRKDGYCGIYCIGCLSLRHHWAFDVRGPTQSQPSRSPTLSFVGCCISVQNLHLFLSRATEEHVFSGLFASFHLSNTIAKNKLKNKMIPCIQISHIMFVKEKKNEMVTNIKNNIFFVLILLSKDKKTYILKKILITINYIK